VALTTTCSREQRYRQGRKKGFLVLSSFLFASRESVYCSTLHPHTLIVNEDMARSYDAERRAYRTSLIVLISGPDDRGAGPRASNA